MNEINKLTDYHRILYLLNFTGLMALLVVSFLANALPINGQTTAEISGYYDNLFTPAGLTFSIWSVIYIGLVAYLLFQFRAIKGIKSPEKPSGFVTAGLGLTFFISCMANLSWIISWHYEQLTLSLILITLLLLSLIDVNRRIYSMTKGSHVLPKYFNWYVKAPFGLYLGWVCITFFANMTVYLASFGWGDMGISEYSLTIIFIVLSGIIGLWFIDQIQQYFAAAAIAWGIFGILFKYWQSETNPAIQITSLMVLALLALAFARTFRRSNTGKNKIQLS